MCSCSTWFVLTGKINSFRDCRVSAEERMAKKKGEVRELGGIVVLNMAYF